MLTTATHAVMPPTSILEYLTCIMRQRFCIFNKLNQSEKNESVAPRPIDDLYVMHTIERTHSHEHDAARHTAESYNETFAVRAQRTQDHVYVGG